MKYNIAVCISGHLRSYEKTNSSFKEFKKILNNFCEDVDVFVAAWDKKEAQSSWAIYHGLFSKREDVTELNIQNAFFPKGLILLDDDFYNSEFSVLNYSLLSTNLLKTIPNDPSYFKTKTPYYISGSKYITVDERMVFNNVTHVSKMLFLKQQALTLKRKYQFAKNKKYDLVFYSRPDIMYNVDFLKSIDFEKIINLYKNDNCVFTYSVMHDGYPKVKDKCIFGSETGMDIFMNSYSALPSLYFNNEFPDGEFANALNLLNFGVKIIPFDEIGLLSSESSSMLR